MKMFQKKNPHFLLFQVLPVRPIFKETDVKWIISGESDDEG